VTPPLAEELVEAAASPADNLPYCALLLARVAYPRLDPAPSLRELERMGMMARDHLEIGLGGRPRRRMRLRIVTEFVFGQLGFTGNLEQYGDPRNSLLNDVLTRRTGIPITLATVFIDIARRAGLSVEGVNFPGHFLVRCLPDDGPQPEESEPLLVDPFHAGAVLTTQECTRLLRTQLGAEALLEPGMLQTATKRDTLVRMLLNLKRAYVHLRSFSQAHAVAELLVALDPSALAELRDRGLLASQIRKDAAALRDLQAWLAHAPDANEQEQESRQQIWEHVKELRRRMAGMN
jgi:regulator of sirC expression with transglutaminase-like and TPR domain